MPFSGDLDPNIIQDVKEEYKKAAFWLPFKAIEIQKVFNEDELEELSGFLKEVKEAGTSNLKKARAVERHSKIGFKLLKLGNIV
ncbi:hypothetical protein KA005_54480 [bacterium]|nr:hypothetical protein [bacterium]